MFALILWTVLALFSSSASAFNCEGAKLPWDIVVCSDRDLQRLADERLAAFEEAKSRLTEAQIQNLRQDQAAWVRSYSASCGIRPDTIVPSPVPAGIADCFRRAGEARLAYLKAYGSSPRDPMITSTSAASEPSADAPASEMVLMQPSGGVYFIPVGINGALTLRFIIDSGASDVSIPADVALTLARTGTIADGDFIGNQRYRLGDGSTVKSARFVLRELQVGKQVVRNVVASIGPVESVPLLGQSFLSHLTSWTVDNEKHALLLGNGRANRSTDGALTEQAPRTERSDATVALKVPPLKPPKRWVVVASRDDLKDAVSVAQAYKGSFPNTAVLKSENGRYGIVIGQFEESTLAQMIASGRIPKDAYSSLGKRFLNVVWP
jgi:predicted aspartyl protease/uncharacterized protein YecT (DUF1311 family)